MSVGSLVAEALKEAHAKPVFRATWCDWLGLEYDPFTEATEYSHIEKLFVDREPEVKNFLTVLISSAHGRGGSIAFVAPSGMGKTYFLRYCLTLLENSRKKMDDELLAKARGQMFSFEDLEDGDEEDEDPPKSKILRWLDEVGDSTFIIFDACELDLSSVPRIRSRPSVRGKLVVFVFSTIAWQVMKEQFPRFVESVDSIFTLSPLTREVVKEVIIRRVGEDLFAPDAMGSIAAHSSGIPRYVIELARKSLTTCAQRSKKRVEKTVVEEVSTNDLSLRVVGDTIERLTAKQREIALDLAKEPAGATADAICSKLNITRPTAVHHLREMLQKDAVRTRLSGRSVTYILKDAVRTFLEIQLERGGKDAILSI